MDGKLRLTDLGIDLILMVLDQGTKMYTEKTSHLRPFQINPGPLQLAFEMQLFISLMQRFQCV